MIQRICNLSNSRSFFLFGPRGVGKSTLLESWSKVRSYKLYDLLDATTEIELNKNPNQIIEHWLAEKTEWIIVDEIQKIPKLLDIVQSGIVRHKIKFALTGSSARKLRRGSANLLGGRANEFHLHPLTHLELKKSFNLLEAITWGTLPEVHTLEISERTRALYSYVSTYLKEEVLVEQLIRKIEPFRRFLEVAGQMNGKILNFAKISNDSGVEEKSVARYYQILDDTLLGFFLDPYHQSLRKRQSKKAKFYFFDCGVTRALQNQLTVPLTEQTYSYGDLFEQLVVVEFIRLNDYFEKNYKFSYLLTKENIEIDLIIERPGQSPVLVEIKSNKENSDEDAKNLRHIGPSFKNPALYVLNNCEKSIIKDGVKFANWKKGIQEIFGVK